MKYGWLLLLLCLFSPLQAIDATSSRMDKQDVYELLKSGDSAVVRALPAGDRELFLATIAMNQGKIRTALVFLKAEKVKKNRLAALIRAEAYRRQSVQAADRAGRYAHAVNDDISKLKQAKITTGLDEANKRLHAFMVGLNAASASRVLESELARQAPELAVQTTAEPRPTVVALAKPEREVFPPVVNLMKPRELIKPRESIKPKPVPLKLATLKDVEFAPREEKISNMADVPPAKAIKSIKPIKAAKPVKVIKKTKPVKKVATFNSIPIAQSVRQSIENWRQDWQSRDSNAYLSHYHKAFKTLKHDYQSWVKYKRRVNAKKTFIQVDISQLKVIPSSERLQEGEAVLVTFQQRYRSSNYNQVSHKQLYMARENAGSPWLILYEGDGS